MKPTKRSGRKGRPQAAGKKAGARTTRPGKRGPVKGDHAARQGRDRWQELIETSAAWIWETDADIRHTYTNAFVKRCLGYEPAEFLALDTADLIHPDDRSTMMKLVQSARSRKEGWFGQVLRWRHKDGSWRDIESNGSVLFDAQGGFAGLCGVDRDISEQRRTERKLRESEIRLNTILDNIGAAVFIKDTNYRYTYVNRMVCEIIGKAPEEVLGKGDDAFFSRESVREIMRSDRPVVDRGETVSREEAGLTALDGLPRSYWTVKLPLRDAEGNITGLCGISTDITEHKRAVEALRLSEAWTRGIFESLPIGVHLYRLEPDGRLVFTGANPAADRILGVDNRAFIGKTIEEAFPPLKDTEVPRRYRDVASSGKPWQTEQIEYQDEAIKGAFEVHAFQTAPNTMAAAFEDITARKQAEATLKKSEEKYRRLYHDTPVLLHSIDPNGNLVEVNEYWLQTLGYERREVIGRKVTDFYTDASRKYAQEVIHPAFFRNGVVKNVAYQFVKKNGEIVDVLLSATAERDAEGRVVRSQAVIEDVTDRKRAEARLSHSHDLMRYIIEHTRSAIAVHDRDLKYIFVSQRYLDDYHVKEKDIIGKHHYEVFPDLPQKWRDVHQRVLKGEVLSAEDDPYYRDDGTVEWTRWECRPWYESSGTIGGIIVYTEVITDRKRAEEALQKSERMLQTIIDAEPECVKLLDEHANLIMMNRAGLDMLQVESLDQVKGQCVCPMVTSEYRDAFMDLTRRIFQGESGNLVFEMVGARGRRLWLETHAVPLRNEKDQITALLGVTRDVTERKRAEVEARRNEARMASLFRISQQPTADEQAFLDLALHEAISLTGSVIGYLYFYDEAKREFNLNSYSRDVMKECAVADRKTCYELDRTGIWGEAVRQRIPILLNDFEADHPLKKGYPEGHARLRNFLTIPVIMQGAVVAVVGVANKQEDYTDADVLQLNFLMDSVWKMIQRARAENALHENQARLDLALQSAHMGVWRLEISENKRYFDELTCQLLGISRATFTGTADEFFRIVHPEDRDKVQEALRRTLEHDAPYEPEYRVTWPDGTIRHITARGRLVRDDHGLPVRVNGIIWDVTEKQLLEEERIKTQRLESLGTLAGGIAHDFNNLLQGVFGYISMAKLTHDKKEKSLAMLEQAEKALHQSVNLTSQLLTFSKGGKPLKKVTDLRPVIENAIKFALSGSRTTAELTFSDDLKQADADVGQIGQVVQNLVLNADQAMPEGGTVRILVENAPASRLPHGLAAGNYVMISIRDSGIGISQQYLKKIFDPYFTTKEKGSGLGLATSHSIVKNHGGALEVVSEVGQGSTFTVYLPASEQETAAAAGSVPSLCGRTCRILVMDDEELVGKVACELLAGLGHSVDLAVHGEEAVGKYLQAKAEGSPFDIVILDLTIRGGMGGAETMQRLREIDPGVKAIVSSGYSDDEVVANFREHGFAAFLKKPYDLTGLQATLNELLA